MRRTISKEFTVLSNPSGTGWGNVVDVGDFQHIMLVLAPNSLANFTVKVAGSLQEAKPDFTATRDDDNRWDYVEVFDLQDSTVRVPGDTGIALSGADCRQLIINVAGLRWATVEVSAYTAGGGEVKLVGATNL